MYIHSVYIYFFFLKYHSVGNETAKQCCITIHRRATSPHVVHLLGTILQPHRIAYAMEHLRENLQRHLYRRRRVISHAVLR